MSYSTFKMAINGLDEKIEYPVAMAFNLYGHIWVVHHKPGNWGLPITSSEFVTSEFESGMMLKCGSKATIADQVVASSEFITSCDTNEIDTFLGKLGEL